MLDRPGFEPTASRSADRRSPNWANRAAGTSHVCDRSMTVTVSYGAYLPNAFGRRIAFQFSENQTSTVCLFGRFHLLRVWQRREEALSECSYLCFMELTSVSDWFRFADFLLIRISTFPVLRISGFRHFWFLRQSAFDLVESVEWKVNSRL